jgi:hypothetical protein
MLFTAQPGTVKPVATLHGSKRHILFQNPTIVAFQKCCNLIAILD